MARMTLKQLLLHDAKTAAHTLQVGGMTCSSCSGAVEDALGSCAGVSKAVVSLIQQEARVEYLTAQTSEARAVSPPPLLFFDDT